MRNILVLGANSFIGLSLIPELLKDGYYVHALTRKPLSGITHKNLTIHISDIKNNILISELLEQCELSVNLICGTTPGTSADDPVKELDDNLIPLIRFIGLLQHSKDHHHIYVSTGGAMYGDTDKSAALETNLPNPKSYYAAGKASIESFLSALHNCYGHKITILRPSNLYGPYQPLKTSFGLIRTILEHAKNNTTIEIWGDGNSVRDYLYITDFIEAMMLIIKNTNNQGIKIYNIANDVQYSANEIISVVETLLQCNIEFIYRPTRKCDLNVVTLDTQAIVSDYNWKAVTSLEEGIIKTWKWLNAKS